MLFLPQFLSCTQYIIYSRDVDTWQIIMWSCKSFLFVKLHRQKCFPQSWGSHFRGTVRLPCRTLTSAIGLHHRSTKPDTSPTIFRTMHRKVKIFVKSCFIFPTIFLLTAVLFLHLDVLLNFLEKIISIGSSVSASSSVLSSTHHFYFRSNSLFHVLKVSIDVGLLTGVIEFYGT